MNDSTKYNDEQLRRQLEGYTEMPSDKVWSGVAKALEQKKKKRRLLFWFLLLGGIACGSALWFRGDTTRPGREQTAQQTGKNAAGRSATLHTAPAGKKTADQTAGAVPATENERAHTSGSTAVSATPVKGSGSAQAGTTQVRTDPARGRESTSPSDAPGEIGLTRDGSLYTNTDALPGIAESTVATAAPRRNTPTPGTPYGTTAQRNALTSVQHTYTLRPLSIPGKGAFTLYTGTPGPALRENNLREGAYFRPAIRPVYPKIDPFISLEASAGSVWYDRRSVSGPQNGLAEKSMQSRTSGLYAAGIFKGGFFFGRHGIFSAGMGYEYYGFSNPYALTYSGTPNIGTGSAPENISAGSYESFGDVSIPLPVTSYSGPQKTFNGRLHMQTHNLFFPLDLGVRYNFRNFSLGLTAGPAFHALLRQNVYFRNEDGTKLPVDISKPASFNISLGVEPVLAYRIRNWGLFASGGFRYHLLSAVEDPSVRSYPYRANGQLGLRYHLR